MYSKHHTKTCFILPIIIVYGPTTPQKEKKSPEDKSSNKDADNSIDSQGYTLETWLFDKLPLITTFAVQVLITWTTCGSTS